MLDPQNKIKKMINDNLINLSYRVLTLLHLHPDQNFQLFNYVIRTLWLLTSIIVAFMAIINFLNPDLTTEALKENANLMMVFIQVPRTR